MGHPVASPLATVELGMTFDRWIVLLTSVVALLTALATLLTIREMKRQRKSAYKPDLLIHPVSFGVKQTTDPQRFPVRLSNIEGAPDSLARGLAVTLYNAGAGTAKYIEIDWHFDVAEFAKQIATLSSVFTIDSGKVSSGFLDISVAGGRQISVMHNLRSQTKAEITVLPPLVEIALQLPDVLTDLMAVYAIGLSSAKTDGRLGNAFSLPQIRATLRYADLENNQHTKELILSPGFSMLHVGRPPDVEYSNPLATGRIDVVENVA